MRTSPPHGWDQADALSHSPRYKMDAASPATPWTAGVSMLITVPIGIMVPAVWRLAQF